MRNNTGLDYFPLDVDFFQDEKIQFISARFGTKGEAVTMRLLCKLYREGYFTAWNEDTALLFARSVGDDCPHTLVNDVVYELLKRGFFDKSIFERFGVLTSRGIQKRYLEATSRRKDVVLVADYLLVDVGNYPNTRQVRLDVNISADNVYISPDDVDISTQSKVKKSRVKKSTVQQSREDAFAFAQAHSSATPSSAEKVHFGELRNVLLTEEERQKLDEKLGIPVAVRLIDDLSLYLGRTSKKYTSHYATLLTWHRSELKKAAEGTEVIQQGRQQPSTSRSSNPFRDMLREGRHEGGNVIDVEPDDTPFCDD